MFFLINWFTNTLYCGIIKKEIQYIVFRERVSGPTVHRRRPKYGTDVRMDGHRLSDGSTRRFKPTPCHQSAKAEINQSGLLAVEETLFPLYLALYSGRKQMAHV